MPRTDPVLIFDLDGTILRGNSFPRWVLSLLSSGTSHGWRTGLAIAWRVQRLLLQRKLRRIDHEQFLGALQDIWAQTDNPARAARFQSRMLKLVRPSLRAALRCVADGSADAVLATAAAAEYAEPLGRALGFRYVLATPCGSQERQPCNRGAIKRDRVLAFLDTHGWSARPRIFFTDHVDDLPLIAVCQTVCWFGGTKGLQQARKTAPQTRLVPCRRLRKDELHQTLAHLRQSLEAAQLANMVAATWSRARAAS